MVGVGVACWSRARRIIWITRLQGKDLLLHYLLPGQLKTARLAYDKIQLVEKEDKGMSSKRREGPLGRVLRCQSVVDRKAASFGEPSELCCRRSTASGAVQAAIPLTVSMPRTDINMLEV